MFPKKQRKKVALALTVMAVIMSLTVVTAFATEVEVNVPQGFKFGTYTQQPWAGKTLRVAMVAEPRCDALKKLVGEFEKLTGIKVNFDILAYPTLQEKQMVALTQGSSAYDVVHVDCVWVGQYAGEGWTIPLEKFILRTNHDTLALDDFIPSIVQEQGMWEDRIHGLPFINAIFGLHYRTDIFNKYGVDAPQTWKELKETAEKLNLKESGVSGITFMGRRGVQLQCSYDNMLWSFGGDWYDKNYRPVINSPAAVDALSYFKSLIPFAPLGVLTYDWDESARTFAGGRATMNLQWANSAPMAADSSKSKIVGKFNFASIPGKLQSDGSIKRTPTFGGWSLEIPVDAKLKEAAWEFIVWATTPQIEPRLAYAQPGDRYSSLEDPELQAKYVEYAGTLAGLPTAKGRPRIAAYSELADALEVGLSEGMTGAKTPQKALDGTNSKFKFILKKWGYLK